MPDQNPTDPSLNPITTNQSDTTPSETSFATTSTPPSAMDSTSVPPAMMPEDTSATFTPPPADSAPPPPVEGSDLPPAPPIVESAGQETGGSAAPAFDIDSSITPPPTPKKKFGGKKVIATILGIMVLIGGLGAGIILVQQQQDIRQRAAEDEGGGSGSCVGLSIQACQNRSDCMWTGGSSGVCVSRVFTSTPTTTCTPAGQCLPSGGTCCAGSGAISVSETSCPSRHRCSTLPTPTQTGVNICALAQRDPSSQGYCDRSAPNTPNCTDKTEGSSCTIVAQCGGGTGTCVVINQGGANSECQCQKGAASTPVPTLTPPPGGGVVAQCLNIRAFDTNWTELTAAQLSQLKAGDKVRFAVAGTATSGSFDKAKFKINGVERPEVATKKPGSEEFYDEYTIPEGITTFTINAQIHHTSLGWSN